jgi:hypothetical protein
MPENEMTNADNPPKSSEDQKSSQRGLRWIIAAGFIAVVAVIFVASFWISPVDRTRFITEFILTVALADLVAVQAYIYKEQWTVMERQFTEFENQTRQNEWAFRMNRRNASATQAQMEKQSSTMKGQLEAIQKQAEFMESSLAETRKLVEQNERAVKAAEANVKIVEQTAVYANRAYLVAKIAGTSVDSTRLQFRLRIENTGNTPANNVRIGYSYGLRTEPPYNAADERVVAFDADFPQWESLGLIASNSEATVNTGKSGPFTGPEAQDWKLGKLKFYCWGRIVYKDIFQYQRYTDFCFCQSFKETKGAPCDYQTEAI